MPARLFVLALLTCLALSCPAQADDLVVVVNPKIGVNKLTRQEVIDIYMGRTRQLPSGATALPLDVSPSQPERARFYEQLTGKSIAEINAYWARLMFSGRASPPAQVRNQEEALLMVMDNRSALSYIERSKVTPQVKVVFELVNP